MSELLKQAYRQYRTEAEPPPVFDENDELSKGTDSGESEESSVEKLDDFDATLTNSRKEFMLSEKGINQCIKACRCAKNCNLNWTRNNIYEMREEFYSSDKSKDQRYSYLLTFMRTHYDAVAKRFDFKLFGVSTCKKCFKLFWGLSNYLYYEFANAIVHNAPLKISTESMYKQVETVAVSVRAFLEEVKWAAEFQPDLAEYHINLDLQKVDIFDEYTEEMKSAKKREQDIADYSSFTRIWRDEFRDLKLPKYCRLGKCNECSDMKVKINDAKCMSLFNCSHSHVLAKLARKCEQQKLKEHKNEMKAERREVERLHGKSKFNATQVSIMSDWMTNLGTL
jgi:hypothetical protein